MTLFTITIAIVAGVAVYRATHAYNKVQELERRLEHAEKTLMTRIT